MGSRCSEAPVTRPQGRPAAMLTRGGSRRGEGGKVLLNGKTEKWGWCSAPEGTSPCWVKRVSGQEAWPPVFLWPSRAVSCLARGPGQLACSVPPASWAGARGEQRAHHPQAAAAQPSSLGNSSKIFTRHPLLQKVLPSLEAYWQTLLCLYEASSMLLTQRVPSVVQQKDVLRISRTRSMPTTEC